jgi:endoglucanase
MSRRSRTWLAVAAAPLVVLACIAGTAQQGGGGPPGPLRALPAGVVAPDVVVVTLRDGAITYGRQVPYVRADGDRIETPDPDSDLPHRWIRRDGRVIGALVGPRGDTMQTFDAVAGAANDVGWLEQPAAFALTSADDERFAAPVRPRAVHRKSVPVDIARLDEYWKVDAVREHRFYLVLPQALRAGSRYTIAFAGERLPALSLEHAPLRARSEAVHVSQVGFRPDDPRKQGYLSTWLGTGGGLRYAPGLRVDIVDAGGRVAYTTSASPAVAAGDAEDAYGRNYNGTDVHRFDFSPLREPGTYRACVDGIGCSYPFAIGDAVWRDAFTVSARGLYHQRSGIVLGPPYTDFVRPRGFHPDDGVRVTQSRVALLDVFEDGMDDSGRTFRMLAGGMTDEPVADAWGGWMDAGDFDRRIQHLLASRYLVDLALEFPGYFSSLDLRIPESSNALPDIVDEALYNIDFYMRLQLPDGGVRGGIESLQHPRFGEASWQESLPVVAFAPDMWSSYLYAAAAAQASLFLQSRDAGRAQALAASALRAMQWAEAAHAREARTLHHMVRDARNLAAADLYRLTGETRWHRLFLETTVFGDPAADLVKWQHHDQGEAAWSYLRSDAATDPAVRDNARRALLRAADASAAQGERTAFGWTRDPYAPPFLFPIPHGVELARAHRLSGDERYLAGLVASTQFGLGANPLNLVYTTGVGTASVVHPLQVDHRLSGQPAPPGITVFGPIHHSFGPFTGPFGHLVAPHAVPDDFDDWPGVESFWDVFWFVAMDEYTIHQTMAPTLYAWGYLAARDEAAPAAGAATAPATPAAPRP